MKYIYSVINAFDGNFENITTSNNDIDFVTFPAIVGNPNYDQFLVSAKLTDKKVHALEPDVWFDFPGGTN